MIEVLDFQERMKGIRSQGTEHHAWLVYGLIRWLRPEVVLETGPWQGYMTAHIALALMHNEAGSVTSIDNFAYTDGNSLGNLMNNLINSGVYGYHVKLIEGNSLDVPWPEHIDLAILDGDRSAPNFSKEVQRVIDSGAICFCVHDTHHDPEAYWFMKEFRETHPDWSVIDPTIEGGFAVAMKNVAGRLTGWMPS
jgi:predicted O-methyltransferase YrrM